MSLRLALLNALSRRIAKRRLARVKTPQDARRDFDLFTSLVVRTPPGTQITTEPASGEVPLLTRVSCGSTDPRRVLLYFHGGAFIAGSPRTHRGIAARLSLLSGLAVVLPDYRLAPEHPFPAAQDDCRAAWEALLARGLRPDEIALGGDSAGGNLALGLLAGLCAARTPPAGLVAFSPFTDFTGSGASIRTNAHADRILPAGRLEELAGFALGGQSRDDPRVSPLFAEFPDPPPALFQVAETEILRDDTVRMAEKLRAAGGEVVVEAWPDAPHVWQIFDGWIPEARDALASSAAFLRRVFSLPPGSTGGS